MTISEVQLPGIPSPYLIDFGDLNKFYHHFTFNFFDTSN